MDRCNKLVDVGRRQFLRGGAFAAAGMATAVALPAQAQTKSSRDLALVEYPSNKLANVADLKANEPLEVNYPDENAPGVLLKLGTKVEGGAGPDGDIVGFSTTCPHKGFPLNYNADDHSFNCPGHYSRFDADAGGSRSGGSRRPTFPSTRCGSTARATSMPRGWTNSSTAA